MTSLRMHAPTACTFGFPAATRRSKNPWRTGLNRTAVSVGRYRAFRSRAFPDFDSRVRPRTLDPLLNSRGDSPQYAAAAWADGTRSRAGRVHPPASGGGGGPGGGGLVGGARGDQRGVAFFRFVPPAAHPPGVLARGGVDGAPPPPGGGGGAGGGVLVPAGGLHPEA